MPDPELPPFLGATPFFGGLPQPSLEKVASMLLPRPVKAGNVVFREGDQGNSLFVVREGELIVFHAAAPGEAPVRLTRLGPGDFFGEMTLIEMMPRSATVQAERDSLLLEFRALDLYALYKQDLKAYVLVLQNVNRELCRRLRSTSQRLAEWAAGAHDETTQVGLQRVR